MALVEQPERVGEILDRIADWQIRAADRFIEIGVDAARISDDYGSQQNLLMSPRTWRILIKPRLQRLVQHYQNVDIPVALHSCGNLELIMDDLVDMGIAAFNIQTNANPIGEYKKRFGKKFRLWGGVSTQDVLSSGTPQQIGTAVRIAIQEYGADRMLILEPDQIIQTPDENLAIFWKLARELRPEAGNF